MAIQLEMALLETTEAWNRLNPLLKEILTLAFRTDGDLLAAVETANPHFSRQRAEAVSTSILEDETVKAILLLRSGAVALSSEPPAGSLEALIRQPEWAALEPIRIKLQADDTDSLLDVRRILTLYWTVAPDLRDAIGMHLPHLSQDSVAEVAKFLYECEQVRRIFALKRCAE